MVRSRVGVFQFRVTMSVQSNNQFSIINVFSLGSAIRIKINKCVEQKRIIFTFEQIIEMVHSNESYVINKRT